MVPWRNVHTQFRFLFRDGDPRLSDPENQEQHPNILPSPLSLTQFARPEKKIQTNRIDNLRKGK